MYFFTKNQNLKKKNNIFVSWGWRGWRDIWTDRRTGPNQCAPSTSSKLGA